MPMTVKDDCKVNAVVSSGIEVVLTGANVVVGVVGASVSGIVSVHGAAVVIRTADITGAVVSFTMPILSQAVKAVKPKPFS